jgi:hypothetical protein
MKHLVAALLLTSTLGCGEVDPDLAFLDDYTFVWEGQHVTVYGYEREAADACAGSFAALERQNASAIEFFGLAEDLHYNYRWMSPAIWEGKCPPEAGACTAVGEPWARELPNMHEVGHALVHAGFGLKSPFVIDWCPWMLSEGISEYLSEPRHFRSPNGAPPEYADVNLELLTALRYEWSAYALSGLFVSYLIETYGPRAVIDLCRAVPRISTPADWERAALDHLGQPVEVMLAGFRKYPRCRYHQYRARLWECAGEPDLVVSPSGTTSLEVRVDCAADERTFGPLRGRVLTTRRILVPEDMELRVNFIDEDGFGLLKGYVTFDIQECAPCSAEPLVVSSDSSWRADYRAGMYDLIVYGDVDEPVTYTVEFSRL